MILRFSFKILWSILFPWKIWYFYVWVSTRYYDNVSALVPPSKSKATWNQQIPYPTDTGVRVYGMTEPCPQMKLLLYGSILWCTHSWWSICSQCRTVVSTPKNGVFGRIWVEILSSHSSILHMYQYCMYVLYRIYIWGIHMLDQMVHNTYHTTRKTVICPVRHRYSASQVRVETQGVYTTYARKTAPKKRMVMHLGIWLSWN